MNNPGTLQQSTFASILGGGGVAVGAWALSRFAHVDVPGDISSTVSLMVMALLTHFVPDKPGPPTV